MRLFRSAIIAMLAVFTLPALAADDINGRWVASVDAGQGPIELTFDLKADAEGKLTGSLSVADMPATPINEGTVKGEDVEWTLDFAMGEGMPGLRIGYKGKLKGDELAVQSSFSMGPDAPPTVTDFVAKRAK